MNAARPAEILRQLEQTGTADDALLARFVATRDAAAFAELVRRHGALVLGVCRRVTGHRQDAEDAFQATFLVLAQRASALHTGVRLWSWLYGVAYRVAWRARRTATRRRQREIIVAVRTEPVAPPPSSEQPEWMPVLDEELAALPAHYREAIVLCDIRSVSRAEAATLLGVPEGTLSSRLANGRKKLAARLTRRGVSLAVVALPAALTEAQAGTVVPTELITTTCGLVADFAANGAVPGPLARLIEGGFAVRKIVVFGALVAMAGAVFAATARDDEPLVETTPSAVAAKIDDAPPLKPAPEPKSGTAYVDAPRIAAGWDIPLAVPSRVVWAPTGSRLAVAGTVRNPEQQNDLGYLAFVVMEYTGKPEPENPSRNRMPKNGSLVGFTTDGKQLITDRRESHLLSGVHQLVYWDPAKAVRPGLGAHFVLGDDAKLRTVTFEGADLHGFAYSYGFQRNGYAFAPDGKSFRALRYRRSPNSTPKTMEVIEIDTATGRAGKPLMRIDYGAHAFSSDGKRLAVVDMTSGTVRAFDLERWEKPELFEFTLPPEKTQWVFDGSLVISFSPDGKRLAVSFGVARSFILNVETGKPLAALEGSHVLDGEPSCFSFSPDGRLFAGCGQAIKLEITVDNGNARTQPVRGDSFLAVWDTDTGRAVKTWSRRSLSAVAFHPARALLAVAEPSGDGETRLGFWDFAADAEKK
ncbi:sigma-70 family RNA polymerase sigma factor [Frigoriglobus tundricola]|nr:sigma-70 family RNA polymerase sigma factor [Frigoriglobus tundricola]